MLAQVKEFSEVGKNAFSLLRDALLFLLLLLLVGCPGYVNKRLSDAGINKVEGFGVSWERLEVAQQKSVSAINDVEQLRRSNAELIRGIDKLGKEHPELAPIRAALVEAGAKLDETTRSVTSAASDQQKILTANAPAAHILSGWVAGNFLRGRLAPDERVTVVQPRPLNVRTRPGTEFPTLGVLPPGTQVRIVELSSQPRGWARVTTEP